MQSQNFHTAYYNAWETDYIEDPIIPIAGELYEMFLANNEAEKANNFLYQLPFVAPKAILNFLKHKTQEYIGDDTLKDVCNSTEVLSSSMLEVVDKYKEAKQSIFDLRDTLSSIARHSETPYIFFIDELDRCRPSYAVRVLERIKHLFAVPNIVFVLSIDKSQLANAIRGFYGSDKLDADEYLRRFIDIEYLLPQTTDIDDFIDYLFDYFGFSSIFSYVKNSSDAISNFKRLVRIYFNRLPLTPRQGEKLFANCRIALSQLSNKTETSICLVFSLLFIRLYHPNTYDSIIQHNIPIDFFVRTFEGVFPMNFFQSLSEYDQDTTFFHNHIAQIIVSYFHKAIFDNSNVFWADKDKKTLVFDTGYLNNDKLIKFLNNPYNSVNHIPDIEHIIKCVEFASAFK